MNLTETLKRGKIVEYGDYMVAEGEEESYLLIDDSAVKLTNFTSEQAREILKEVYGAGGEEIIVEQGYYFPTLFEEARKIPDKTLDITALTFSFRDEVVVNIYNVPASIGYPLLDAIGFRDYDCLEQLEEDGILEFTNERNAYAIGTIVSYLLEFPDLDNNEELYNKLKSRTMSTDELKSLLPTKCSTIIPPHTDFDLILEMYNDYLKKEQFTWKDGEYKLCELK